MKQFIKLKDKNTICYPPELTGSKKHAIKEWGADKFVQRDIKLSEDPAIFADKLVNGKIVIDEKREEESKKFNQEIQDKKRDQAKISRRSIAIDKAKSKIDADKKFDDLTPLEKKLMFGIGVISDKELGIK